MSLRGTLADIGIVDLIQFPHSGRKTGELTLSQEGEEVRLFYEKGTLIHALRGELVGMDVLVEVLDWSEGEFEFRLGEEAQERTIEMDLHRAVMQALKLRDERKAEEERRRREGNAATAAVTDQDISRHLQQFLAANSVAVYACVLDPEGNVIAEANNSGIPQNIQEIQKLMLAVLLAYPNTGLQRLFADDSLGSVVVSRLQDNHALLMVAKKGASMGAVSVTMSKLQSDFV